MAMGTIVSIQPAGTSHFHRDSMQPARQHDLEADPESRLLLRRSYARI